MKKSLEIATSFICPFCKAETLLSLPAKGLVSYYNGALVQEAFPELDASAREVIISGMCLDCQAKVFGSDDDEDSDEFDDLYNDLVDFNDELDEFEDFDDEDFDEEYWKDFVERAQQLSFDNADEECPKD